MRVLLVSGRPAGAPISDLGAELTALGHQVENLAAAPCSVSFSKVTAGLFDAGLERRVTTAIRAALPDAVHCRGLVRGCAQVPWIARALGAVCTVEVEAAALVCHRGDLVHAGGAACATFASPERCAACCRQRPRGGRPPSFWQALLAGATRFLGDHALGPKPLAFRNRTDLLCGTLEDAAAVVVGDAEQARQVIAFGVAADRLRVCAADAAALVALWRSLPRVAPT